MLSPVRPSTLLGVLFLRRDAILDAFHSRWSLPVGGLLVFSAALARNYDGEDLLAEPWWLAGPFVASLLTSFILWCLFIIWAKVPGPPLWRIYPRFLGIYWLTAPLAWLYAVPYERFLSPVDAVRANAYTLLVVSLWRVLIISRALSVLFTVRFRATLAFTLMFGSLVMLGATFFGPRPVLDVMGGLRLPPEDNYRASLTFATGFFSIIGLVVFGIAAAIYRPRNPAPTRPLVPAPEVSNRPRTASLAVALLCVLAWIPALLIAQPEQRRRHAAERLFLTGDYPGMLGELSAHTATDYPPAWRLPGSHLPAHSRLDLTKELLPHIDAHTATWVRDGYIEMARESISNFRPFIATDDWITDVIEDAQRYPDQERTAARRAVLNWLNQNDPSLTPAQRNRVNSFLNTPPAEPPSSPP